MNIKQISCKLISNSLFRLCVYIFIENALLTYASITMDYSIGYAAPVANCLCFLFISFEVVFFHSQFIFQVITVLKIATLLVCNYFVGNLNYIIVFSVCFLMLRVSDIIIYNKHNLSEFTFPLTRKELFRRGLSKYISSFIFLQIVIIAVCFLCRNSVYDLIIPFIFAIVANYKDRSERKWCNIHILSYYKTTFIEIVFLVVAVFSIKKIGVIIELEKDILISILVSVFIFNITTLFLLIQFNYSKYGSTYLLKIIVTIPILFFTIIIPVCIILFLGFFAESMIPDTSVLSIVKFCCVTTVFVSSLLYLLFVTQSIESGNLLNTILLSVNDDDIRNNKNSIIPYDETKFDAITRIIKTDISKKDLIALRSDLNGMVYWTRENINKIKTQSNIYWEQIDNRFASFYKEIAVLIAKSEDTNIKDVYLNSLRVFILQTVNHKNFNNYKIFFESAVEYIKVCLEKDAQENASDALYFVKHYISRIIINFSDSDNDKFELTHSFLEPVRDLANKAIKNKQTYFVKRMNLIEGIFNLYEENKPIKWNENYLDFFLCYKTVLKDMIKNADNDNQYINEVSSELEHLCNGLKLQDENQKWVNDFWDYYFDLAQVLIYTGIQKKLILSDSNFEAFYNVYFPWHRNKYENDDVLKKCLICFTISLNAYIKYLEGSGNSQKDYLIQWVWSRFLQIEKYIKNSQKLYSEWKEFKDLFESNFSVLKDYEKFSNLVSESYQPIVGFDYSKIDIRKNGKS